MKPYLLCFLLISLIAHVLSSSHSEAPGTAKKPSSDITDFYMFRSYETGKTDKLILAMGVSGLQNPYAGPNYYTFSDQHYFEFHLSCDLTSGDSAHVFQFFFGGRFNGQGTASYTSDYDYEQPCNTGAGNPSNQRSIALPIANRNVDIALKVAGVVVDDNGNVNEGALNFLESYSINYYTNIAADSYPDGVNPDAVLTRGASAISTFDVPFTYVGEKSFSSTDNYESYARSKIYTTNAFLPCAGLPDQSVKVFAGPRAEPFFIDLGRVFDIVNLVPIVPDGVKNCAENNDIARHNVNYIVMEVPICAVQCGTGDNNIIGGWVGVRELLHDADNTHIAGQLTNRFGNALINELIIGIGDKQLWNYEHPYQEIDFQEYYYYPTFPAILQALFNVPAPNVPDTGRIDLWELLAKGIPGLNRYAAGVPTPMDMQRLNLGSLTDTQDYNGLGVIGGDTAGYPNGRRFFDDVVDITLRAAMGVLCGPGFNGGFGCTPDDAPVYNVAFGDGVGADIDTYSTRSFPFLYPPHPGSVVNPHPHRCSSASVFALNSLVLLVLAALYVFIF